MRGYGGSLNFQGKCHVKLLNAWMSGSFKRRHLQHKQTPA